MSTPAVSGSIARQPRSIVRITNSGLTNIVGGWVSWTVSNSSFFEADTFHVVYAASALLQETDAAWFMAQTETFVEILAGFPTDPVSPDPGELTSFIYGRIDDMEFDPVAQTLTLTGRDLTGAFIDAKVASNYTNQKASDIVLALATAHNLSYQITPTTRRVGSDGSQDAVLLQIGSEWDLLCRLAIQEGFVVSMKRQILYFGPDNSGTGIPLVIAYQPPGNRGGPPIANVIAMSFSRSQTVVKGITVTVRAAGAPYPTAAKSYPTAPRAIAPGHSSPYGGTTHYYDNMPAGTTPDKLQQRAVALYNQIISHAMKLRVQMPADEMTDPFSVIQVRGTGTTCDQTYYPRCVTRHMSVEDGFVMDIDAQNNSPNLTVAVDAA